MPLYEYKCDACGNRFEIIQKFSDPPADTCPSCGGAVSKLPSSPAIQFKGSGWYITDYARKGVATDKEKPAATGTAPEKGEAKPAASGESTGSATPTSTPPGSTGTP